MKLFRTAQVPLVFGAIDVHMWTLKFHKVNPRLHFKIVISVKKNIIITFIVDYRRLGILTRNIDQIWYTVGSCMYICSKVLNLIGWYLPII